MWWDVPRHDSLDPDEPAVAHERHADGCRSRSRALLWVCRQDLARAGGRRQVNREQAREREHEYDERDAHSGRNGFAAEDETPASLIDDAASGADTD
jgi:hypothetical protein